MKKNKLLAGLLSLSLFASMLPVSVYADDVTTDDSIIFSEDFEGAVETEADDGTVTVENPTGFETADTGYVKSTYVTETLEDDTTNQYIQYNRLNTNSIGKTWYTKDLSSYKNKINKYGGIYELSFRLLYNQMTQYGTLFSYTMTTSGSPALTVFEINNDAYSNLKIYGIGNISKYAIAEGTWMDVKVQFSIDASRYVQAKTTIVYIDSTTNEEVTATGTYSVGDAKWHSGGLYQMKITAAFKATNQSGARSDKEWGLDDIVLKEVTDTDYVVNFDTQTTDVTVEAAPITKAGIVVLPAEPVREGYLFGGWYTDSDCTTAFDPMNVATTADVTVYAKWAVVCTVTFDENYEGGSTTTADPDANGVVTLPTPTRDGYIFAGWYEDAELTTAFDGTGVTQSITVYAKWVKIHNITFKNKEEVVLTTTTDVNGKALAMPETPADTAEESFGGWYNGDVRVDANTVFTADAEVVAKWGTLITISFNADGGEGTFANQTIVAGNTIVVPTVAPVKLGYVFDGWYYNGEKVTETTIFNETATVTAQYIKMPVITFDSNGGTEVASQTINPGATITMPEAPTKENHTFIGWFNGDVKVDETTTFDVDTTLVAHWEKMSDEELDELSYIFVERFENAVETEADDGTVTVENPTGFETATTAKVKSTYVTETLEDDTTNQYIQYNRLDATNTSGTWYTKDLSSYKNKINKYGGIYELNFRLLYNQMTQYGTLFSYTTKTSGVGDLAIFEIKNDARDNLNISGIGNISKYAIAEGTWMDVKVQFSIDASRYVQAKTTIVYIDSATNEEVTATGTYGAGNAKWHSGNLYNMTITARFLTTNQSGARSNKEWGLDDIVLKEVTNTDYVVNFDTQTEDVTVAAAPITKAGIVVLPAEPVREGYLFGGWYTDLDYTTAFDPINVATTGNTTVYAKWVKQIIVTFNYNDGATAATTAGADENGTVTLPTPTKDGYCLYGWYTDAACTAGNEFNGTGVTENIEVYAKWLKCVYVTLDSNGGADLATNTIHVHPGVDVDITTIEEPTHQDATLKFAGWYMGTADDAEQFTGAAEQIGEENFTVYAAWKALRIVSFDTNGGNEVAAMETYEGATIQTPTPFKNGYEFLGWYTDNSYSEEFGPATIVTQDITLYAKWSDYTVFIDFEDGETRDGMVTDAAAAVGWTQEVVDMDGNKVLEYTNTLGASGNASTTSSLEVMKYTFNGLKVEMDGEHYYEMGYKFDPIATNNLYCKTFMNFVSVANDRTKNQSLLNAMLNGYEFAIGSIKIDTREVDGFIDVKAIASVNENGTSATVYATYTNTSGELVTLRGSFGAGNSVANFHQATRTGENYIITANNWRNSAQSTAPIYFDDIYMKPVGDSSVSYTVTYDAGKGTFGSTSTQTATANFMGDVANAPQDPTREGYIFGGWYLDKACTKEYQGYGVVGELTVYAKWNVTVSFSTGISTTIDDQIIIEGGKISVPADLARIGYNFAGWYIKDTDTQVTADTIFNENTTVVAKWEIRNAFYQDFENVAENELTGFEVVEEGQNSGWTSEIVTDENGNSSMKFTLDGDIPTVNTAFDVFRKTINDTIYDINGGTFEASYRFTPNGTNIYSTEFMNINLLAGSETARARQSLAIGRINRKTFSVNGLSVDLDEVGGYIDVHVIARVSSDVGTETITFINYVDKNGDLVTMDSHEATHSAYSPFFASGVNGVEFVISQSTYGDWGDSEFYIDNISFRDIPSDITSYTATYLVDGEVYATSVIDQMGNTTLPADPTKEGYTFAKWFSDENCTVEYKGEGIVSDATIYARWQQAPTVVAVSPEDGAINVDVTPTIKVTFDSEIYDSTITKDNFKLYDEEGIYLPQMNYSISRRFVPNSRNTEVTITLNTELPANTKYYIEVGTGVINMAGNMQETYVTSFTTENLRFNVVDETVVTADSNETVVETLESMAKVRVRFKLTKD